MNKLSIVQACASIVAVCVGSAPLAVAAPSANAPDAKQVKVWQLYQTTGQFGPMTMLVGKSAIKMSVDKLGLTWTAHAPGWGSAFYSDENKCIIKRDYDTWKNKLFDMPGSKSRNKGRQPDKLDLRDLHKTEKILGFKCQKHAIYKSVDGRPATHAGNVWITHDIACPPQMREVLLNMVKIDVKDGMLIKAEGQRPTAPGSTVGATARDKEFKPMFDTVKAVSNTVPSSTFDAPFGYKTVSNELELMMGPDSGVGGMDDMQFIKKSR